MKIIPGVSHLDHGCTPRFLEYVEKRFANKHGFFIETFDIPEGFDWLESGIHGPIMGDSPVSEDEVFYDKRGDRPNLSRLVKRKGRLVKKCTVIAGPYKDDDCVLYTIYGGPCAPREATDPNLPPEAKEEAEAFWKDHALSHG